MKQFKNILNGWTRTKIRVRELDYNSEEALHLQGKTDSQENLKNL